MAVWHTGQQAQEEVFVCRKNLIAGQMNCSPLNQSWKRKLRKRKGSNHYKQKSADSTIKTRFLRVVDINKDGIFQFVDLLAAICIIIFCLSASYCWGHFVIFSQIGLSDVNCLIELTKSFSIILLGTFAAVYLSKRSMSPSLERNLGLFSLILLVILVRTVAETLTLPGFQTYKFFMKLAKGLVKGITQLMLGMYILRCNHKSNAASTANKKNL
jgi:hypothetical protein